MLAKRTERIENMMKKMFEMMKSGGCEGVKQEVNNEDNMVNRVNVM